MTTISLHHVRKTFDAAVVAVDDVSLTVGSSEMLVLVGPSGCGKTTLLRLIAGLERADSGDVYFGERLMNEVRPKHRNLSIVFQDYALLPHISVFENIAYGLRSRGMPKNQINSRVQGAARRFRIDHLLKRRPAQLSGGERQRAALARALVRDSAATLFDEPLASLDAQLRQQARADIMQLHQQKKRPSVYVTHDQSEAMAMGDRVAIMQAGKLVQVGKPMTLYDAPANRFVADFIGSGINWFLPAEFPFDSPANAVAAGVRPENLMLTSAETAPFKGTVTAHTGRHFTVTLADHRQLQIYSPATQRVGDVVKIGIGAEHVMWFDYEDNLITSTTQT